MTEKEMANIHFINLEIDKLREQLNKLNYDMQPSCQQITGMPFTGRNSDNVGELAVRKAEISEMIEIKLKELWLERTRAERFINSIDDNEIRIIVRLRAINNMRFEDIAKELGYDRSTVGKKYHKFFRVSHKSHSKEI